MHACTDPEPLLLLPLFAGMLLATGCASTPVADTPGGARHQGSLGSRGLYGRQAISLWRQYAAGFDCSGLVHFSFKNAGMNVPRSTETQRGKAERYRAQAWRAATCCSSTRKESTPHMSASISAANASCTHRRAASACAWTVSPTATGRNICLMRVAFDGRTDK